MCLPSFCFVFLIPGANVPTQVVRAAQLPGAGAPAPPRISDLRSERACHHPIHTSIRPPARLSVTARSPTSPAKPFISGLVQVSASIWRTAHAGKHVRDRAAYCCIVCRVSMFVHRLLNSFTQADWHLCNFGFVHAWHSFTGKLVIKQSYSHNCGPVLHKVCNFRLET